MSSDSWVDARSAVAQIADRVLPRDNAEPADALVATPAGSMRLGDYRPTRTFELTVHTCDLAIAVGQPVDAPLTAAVESLTVLGGLAAQGGNAGHVLLAATGRRDLPPGFTVV